MSAILVPLLANIAVISVMIALWSYTNDRYEIGKPWLASLSFGSCCGIVGCLVMLLPFEPVPGFRFDLRHVVIAIAGFFGGPIGGVVAAALVGVMRLWLGGAGVHVGLIGLSVPLVVGIANGMYKPTMKMTGSRVGVLALTNATSFFLPFTLLPSDIRSIMLSGPTPISLFLVILIGTLLSASAILYDIARKEAALVNRRNTAVLEALPDCLNVKDMNGRFLFANAATAEVMRAGSPSNLVGKSDFDFYTSDVARRFAEDEKQTVTQNKPLRIEQSFEDPAGNLVWLSTLKTPFFNVRGEMVGLITHNRDISEQKRLENELALTQKQLANALAQMADALIMFDKNDQFILHNKRYAEFFPATARFCGPGATLAFILDGAVSSGEIKVPANVSLEEWRNAEIAGIKAGRTSEFSLSDDRWIEKRVSKLDDGGWIIVFSDVTAKKLVAAKLEELADTDGLTGLLNRRAFDTRYMEAFRRSIEHNQYLGLMMIDLDRFKAYNDTYGHPAGDECLKLIATCLSAHCRASDIVARYGGEELVAVFPTTNEKVLRDIAERFRQAVHDLGIPHIGSEKGTVTVSVGMAVHSPSNRFDSPVDLLKTCDMGLYQAKAAGRDCVKDGAGLRIAS